VASLTDEPPDAAGTTPPDTAVGPGRVARARAAVEQTTDRVTAQLRAARARSRAVDLAWTAAERDRRTVGNVLAGAVAFRVFVFLLPLTLAVVVLVGVVAGIDRDGPSRVADTLGASGYLVDSVSTAAEESRRSLWVLVPLTLWAVYFGASGAAKVLRSIHALAWNQPPRRPSSGLATAAATFGLALATMVVLGLDQWARAHSPGLGIGAAVAGLVPLVGLWLLASWLLPHDPAAPWTALVPGAVIVGVGVWLGHLVSAFYLARRIDNAAELYGAMGVAASLLAWLYVLGRLMVASAMLNATLWERRSRPDPADGETAG
jgi:uncharacterized BrkB/YihY/UPF0761 family membrane protein